MSSRKQPDAEKRQFWRLVFEEHAKSGLSVRAFCRQESLSEPSFYSWRRTIRDEDLKRGSDLKSNGDGPSPAGDYTLVPVRISGTLPASSQNGIEIVTPNDILIRLGGDCSGETIRHVLWALQQQASPC
jgi:transposase-like protein